MSQEQAYNVVNNLKAIENDITNVQSIIDNVQTVTVGHRKNCVRYRHMSHVLR